MENGQDDMPALEPVPLSDEPKERAMDFIIKKFCAEETRKTEAYRASVRKTTGKESSFTYDADLDLQWIKKQRRDYMAAKESGYLWPNRAFRILTDAEILATLLLDPSIRLCHSSWRAAEQYRTQLKWFEELPEFKELVLSAVSRVRD